VKAWNERVLKKKTKEEEERAMGRSIHLYGGFLLPFQILSFLS
jgi:hypothetical protein